MIISLFCLLLSFCLMRTRYTISYEKNKRYTLILKHTNNNNIVRFMFLNDFRRNIRLDNKNIV